MLDPLNIGRETNFINPYIKILKLLIIFVKNTIHQIFEFKSIIKYKYSNRKCKDIICLLKQSKFIINLDSIEVLIG